MPAPRAMCFASFFIKNDRMKTNYRRIYWSDFHQVFNKRGYLILGRRLLIWPFPIGQGTLPWQPILGAVRLGPIKIPSLTIGQIWLNLPKFTMTMMSPQMLQTNFFNDSRGRYMSLLSEAFSKYFHQIRLNFHFYPNFSPSILHQVGALGAWPVLPLVENNEDQDRIHICITISINVTPLQDSVWPTVNWIHCRICDHSACRQAEKLRDAQTVVWIKLFLFSPPHAHAFP